MMAAEWITAFTSIAVVFLTAGCFLLGYRIKLLREDLFDLETRVNEMSEEAIALARRVEHLT
jgi:hypothetical protein